MIFDLTGSDSTDAKAGGSFFCGRPEIRRAMQLADRVLQDSPEQRLKIPVCLDASDEEMEDEDMMEVRNNVKHVFILNSDSNFVFAKHVIFVL